MGTTASSRPGGHPGDDALRAYARKELLGEAAESAERHVSSCDDCTRRVATLSGEGPSDRGGGSGGSWASGNASPESDPDHGLAELPGYEILRELGRGGMGVVYLARNTMMGRLEVLKVVGAHLVKNPRVLDRFLREIQSAARLQHKNIVTAYAAMRLGDAVVLAMEFVDGDDLSKLVKSSGPLPVVNACYYAYQAASGLQHAHERGMVHRDIKPANLILAREGKKSVVKVLDFGLAKVTSEGQVDSGLTSEGQMLGTPDYISPEQTIDAQKADIRADIYSLGCTLYYLLTGAPPFRGKSLYDLLQAHQSADAPPLTLARPDVPAELAALVAKMIAKDPADRFQTPGEVAQALAKFVKPGTATPAPTGGQSSQDGPRVEPRTDPAGKTPAEADSWNGLIALGETDRSGSNPGQSRVGPVNAGGKSWLPVASAATALGLAVAAGLYASRVTAPPAPPAAQAPPQPPATATRAAAAAGSGPGPAAAPAPRSVESPSVTRTDVPPPVSSDRRPEPPPQVADDADKPVGPAPVVEIKAIQPGAGGEKTAQPPALDFRRLTASAAFDRIENPPPRQPPGPFWPALTTNDVKSWQVSEPSAVTMTPKWLIVSAGGAGNFLITKRSNYQKVVARFALSASKGTEAYLALHADEQPDGWHAVTSRVVDEGGSIRVGLQGVDFGAEEVGGGTREFAPDKKFRVNFEDNGRGTLRVLVNGVETSKADAKPAPENARTGSVGLFVKSGAVMLESLTVE